MERDFSVFSVGDDDTIVATGDKAGRWGVRKYGWWESFYFYMMVWVFATALGAGGDGERSKRYFNGVVCFARGEPFPTKRSTLEKLHLFKCREGLSGTCNIYKREKLHSAH